MISGTKLLLRFDGSCINNGSRNARGSFGWEVIDRETNQVIATGHGRCEGEVITNNVAEYEGLLLGLNWLACLKEKFHLLIQGDSRLVVETVADNWSCHKDHLRKLQKQVWALLEYMEPLSWSITWIPRRFNSSADSLSRESS